MLGPCCRSLLLVTTACLLTTVPLAIGQTSTPTVTNERHEELKHKSDDAYRAREFDTAISLATQVLAENPRDAVALYLRASAKVEQGIATNDPKLIRTGVEDARAAISADAAKKPDYYLPYLYGMSHLTKFEQKPSHAETATSVASGLLRKPDLDPQLKANLLYQRGVARVQLSQFDDAVADFRRALELSATHLGARIALGDALVKAGKREEAEAALDDAIATFPSSPLVFNNRGMFHQSQQKYEQAIVDFSQAISLNPDYVQAYLNRGFTFLQEGNAEAAIGDFNAVLDREPKNASAISLRGTARLRNGDLKESITDYTRAVELAPGNAAARADLGFAYFFSGDYETAASAFAESLTLRPQNEFLKPWRYTAMVRSGQETAARAEFGSLQDKAIEQQSWFDALTLLLMGELTEDQIISRIESRDARLKDAQLCEAYYFIGVTKQQTDPDEAGAYFRRALRSQAKQLSAYQAAQLAVGGDRTTR